MDVTPSADIIDSRDVIARIAELEAMPFEGLRREDDPEIGDEYAALVDLQEQCEHTEWEYGAVLVRDDYFTEYAQQFAEDVYGFDSATSQWPMCHIDWDAAAASLQIDYTPVEFSGVTYWVR